MSMKTGKLFTLVGLMITSSSIIIMSLTYYISCLLTPSKTVFCFSVSCTRDYFLALIICPSNQQTLNFGFCTDLTKNGEKKSIAHFSVKTAEQSGGLTFLTN